MRTIIPFPIRNNKISTFSPKMIGSIIGRNNVNKPLVLGYFELIFAYNQGQITEQNIYNNVQYQMDVVNNKEIQNFIKHTILNKVVKNAYQIQEKYLNNNYYRINENNIKDITTNISNSNNKSVNVEGFYTQYAKQMYKSEYNNLLIYQNKLSNVLNNRMNIYKNISNADIQSATANVNTRSKLINSNQDISKSDSSYKYLHSSTNGNNNHFKFNSNMIDYDGLELYRNIIKNNISIIGNDNINIYKNIKTDMANINQNHKMMPEQVLLYNIYKKTTNKILLVNAYKAAQQQSVNKKLYRFTNTIKEKIEKSYRHAQAKIKNNVSSINYQELKNVNNYIRFLDEFNKQFATNNVNFSFQNTNGNYIFENVDNDFNNNVENHTFKYFEPILNLVNDTYNSSYANIDYTKHYDSLENIQHIGNYQNQVTNYLNENSIDYKNNITNKFNRLNKINIGKSLFDYANTYENKQDLLNKKYLSYKKYLQNKYFVNHSFSQNVIYQNTKQQFDDKYLSSNADIEKIYSNNNINEYISNGMKLMVNDIINKIIYDDVKNYQENNADISDKYFNINENNLTNSNNKVYEENLSLNSDVELNINNNVSSTKISSNHKLYKELQENKYIKSFINDIENSYKNVFKTEKVQKNQYDRFSISEHILNKYRNFQYKNIADKYNIYKKSTEQKQSINGDIVLKLASESVNRFINFVYANKIEHSNEDTQYALSRLNNLNERLYNLTNDRNVTSDNEKTTVVKDIKNILETSFKTILQSQNSENKEIYEQIYSIKTNLNSVINKAEIIIENKNNIENLAINTKMLNSKVNKFLYNVIENKYNNHLEKNSNLSEFEWQNDYSIKNNINKMFLDNLYKPKIFLNNKLINNNRNDINTKNYKNSTNNLSNFQNFYLGNINQDYLYYDMPYKLNNIYSNTQNVSSPFTNSIADNILKNNRFHTSINKLNSIMTNVTEYKRDYTKLVDNATQNINKIVQSHMQINNNTKNLFAHNSYNYFSNNILSYVYHDLSKLSQNQYVENIINKSALELTSLKNNSFYSRIAENITKIIAADKSYSIQNRYDNKNSYDNQNSYSIQNNYSNQNGYSYFDNTYSNNNINNQTYENNNLFANTYKYLEDKLTNKINKYSNLSSNNTKNYNYDSNTTMINKTSINSNDYMGDNVYNQNKMYNRDIIYTQKQSYNNEMVEKINQQQINIKKIINEKIKNIENAIETKEVNIKQISETVYKSLKKDIKLDRQRKGQ